MLLGAHLSFTAGGHGRSWTGAPRPIVLHQEQGYPMQTFHRCFVVLLCLLPSPAAAIPFTRGDVDQGGRIDVTDAIRILEKLFAGGQGVVCDDAADVDDDGSLTLFDSISLLGALFHGGPAPSAPFPACGEDPTADGLSCEAFEACGLTFGFYTLELSGDAIFFAVDTSGSMPDSGELLRARTEMRQIVEAMPDGMRFGLIFFDTGLVRFPPESGAGNRIARNQDLRRGLPEWYRGRSRHVRRGRSPVGARQREAFRCSAEPRVLRERWWRYLPRWGRVAVPAS